jgi:hypothetical protein
LAVLQVGQVSNCGPGSRTLPNGKAKSHKIHSTVGWIMSEKQVSFFRERNTIIIYMELLEYSLKNSLRDTIPDSLEAFNVRT